MIHAILSSKMYRSSSRKSNINLAYNDPMNSELIQQLESYLGDYENENIDDNSDEDKMTIPDDYHDSNKLDEHNQEDMGNGLETGGKISQADSKESSVGTTDSTDENSDKNQDEEGLDLVDENKDDSENVISSNVSASSDTCSNIWNPQELELMKNSLNSVDATCGVSRIVIKDLEIWIYYNDKINLNNVMLPCISSINSMGYVYLEFSRLARSDNAIVFDVSISSENKLKPVRGMSDAPEES